MATVYGRLDTFSSYRDSKSGLSYEEQLSELHASKTLYIGNLS
jgi:nuclear cap-binding protein subunit 2